uniref:Uncharacterized protein n=1 Tax=Salix viminalis TaxID=40686 RepID=A0A6N2KMS3_SALVM
METEVGVEGNDEAKLKECGIRKSSSSLSSPKQISDPVVYKLVRHKHGIEVACNATISKLLLRVYIHQSLPLVYLINHESLFALVELNGMGHRSSFRTVCWATSCALEEANHQLLSLLNDISPIKFAVEGDGRLVPATEDELMEVESLLIDDRCGIHIDADPGQTVGCISNEGSSSWMAQLESLEVYIVALPSNQNLFCLFLLLLYLNEQYMPDSQCSDPHDKLLHIDEKLQCEIPLQEPVPSLAPSLRESNLNQSGSVGELVAGGSPLSVTTKPDFSILKGEICLDNLSIKELHETFKATFGRETTVKDKQWLKRRISMGLTNSCAVSTNFIIKDNKFAKKGNEEGCNGMYGSFAKDPSIVNQKGLPTCLVGQLDYHKVVSERRLENHNIDDYSGSDDHKNEQRAAKDTKPQSDILKNFQKWSQRVQWKEEELLSHGWIPLEDLGFRFHVFHGSEEAVQGKTSWHFWYKFNPSGMGMAATLVKKALDDHSFPPDDGNEDRVLKASSTPEHVHHLEWIHGDTLRERMKGFIMLFKFVGMPEKGKQFSVMSAVGLGNT